MYFIILGRLLEFVEIQYFFMPNLISFFCFLDCDLRFYNILNMNVIVKS